MVVTTLPGACAVMNITPIGDGEHHIEVLRREDDSSTTSPDFGSYAGYLGTRSKAKDERSGSSIILGLPPLYNSKPMSRFKLVTDSRTEGFAL